MLHRCIEGEKVGVVGSKIVDVDCRHDRCPGGTLAPTGERRGEPPPYSSLAMVAMAAKGRVPLRDWISLSVLFCFAFPLSGRKPFLIFLKICNSNCAEILHDFFPDISFLMPEVEFQPTYKEGTTHHHTLGP